MSYEYEKGTAPKSKVNPNAVYDVAARLNTAKTLRLTADEEGRNKVFADDRQIGLIQNMQVSLTVQNESTIKFLLADPDGREVTVERELTSLELSSDFV